MQMGIEQNVSGRKGNKDKRRQKKLSPVQNLYEICKEVFADCSPGIVPSPQNVEKLSAVLDQMTQADVGLSPDMRFFDNDRAPIITYLHLHECDRFSIGIFCLPPKSVIPLHNHPGMTVFSKLLFGKMHYKSYDWLDEMDTNIDAATANTLQSAFLFTKLMINAFSVCVRLSSTGPDRYSNKVTFSKKNGSSALCWLVTFGILLTLLLSRQEIPTFGPTRLLLQKTSHPTIQPFLNQERGHANGLRLANLKVDSQFTAPCETSILYPAHGGNMHILTAKTACAVLDVLGPPYCDPDGRHCQYYHEFPLNNFPVEGCRLVPEEEQDEYAWLMEREKPEDFYVVGVSYNGPKIAKN